VPDYKIIIHIKEVEATDEIFNMRDGKLRERRREKFVQGIRRGVKSERHLYGLSADDEDGFDFQ
jgi:hypothetical protein